MAKSKRGSSGGGGSNAALVIALVFFILTSGVLGYTTYAGFAEQETLKAAAKKAQGQEKAFQDARDYERSLNRWWRAYIGHAAKEEGKDVGTLGEERQKFIKDQLYKGPEAKDRDQVKNLMALLDKDMPWPAGAAVPNATYESRLKKLEGEITALAKALDDKKDELETEKANVKRARDDLAKEKAKFAKDVADLNKQLVTARANQDDKIDELQKKYEKSTEETKTEALKVLAVEKDLKSQKGARAKAELELKDIREQIATLKVRESDLKSQVDALRQASGGGGAATVDAALQDAKARDLLRNWHKDPGKDWKIVLIGRLGKEGFINLGSRHKLPPQLSFSIHGTAPNGSLLITPKASAEVIEVLGPELSRVRLVYPPADVRDREGLMSRSANPVNIGDRLFNVAWDPNKPKHVVIAGVMDLAGDGRDGFKEFKRALERQGTKIDGFLNMERDEPAFEGALTTKTDFLVIGELPDPAHDARARNPEFNKKVRREIDGLKARARENGATVLSINRFLEMSGIRVPRVINEAKGGAGGYR